MADLHWKTAITKIEPNKVMVRGYNIAELMGNVTFGQVVYLLLKGELPAENVGKIIDAILISSVDHGATPPSTLAAITSASTGAPINAALAVGILSINKFHGGAIETCMETIFEVEKKMTEKDLSMTQACRDLLQEYKAEKKRVTGLGHRYHTNDPRTAKLYSIADELKISGKYVEILKTLEKEMAVSGKKLPINVDGAIASLLCELKFEPYLANAFFIMARLPGLLAHIKEEKERYAPMRQIHPTDFEYDGPPERQQA